MAATPMSLALQQMQPLARGTKGGGAAVVLFADETVSCFSMSIAGVVVLLVWGSGDREGGGRCTVAELVQNHGDSLAVFGGQDVVQQCGFARA
jgi:hypothetical protein